jgi:hypothetical protein
MRPADARPPALASTLPSVALLPDSDAAWEGPVTHAPQRGGKHRRGRARSVIELIALVVAVLGVVRLLTLPGRTAPPGGPRVAAPDRPPAMTQFWPDAEPVSQKAQLTDSTQYTPQLYLDRATSVGTAPTRDGKQLRVLVRDGKGTRELRRLPADEFPQVTAFTASGDDVFWAESTSRGGQAVRTRLYRANWQTGSRPVLLASDMGEAVFAESQFDLVISDGRVHWVAAEFVNSAVTQVRSVPVGGGTVTITRVNGAYTLTTWPWLVTFSSSAQAQVELVNVDTKQRIKLTTTPAEVARCNPQWCRVVVLGGDAVPVRIDLQHPDGSDRRRIAGAEANAVIGDVALLDRFEPLGVAGPSDEVGRDLVLYDIRTGRTVSVASGVDVIRARQGMLWWSTGSDAELTWHSLDLRQLS